MKKYSFIYIPVLAVLLSSLFQFSSIDSKISDQFQRLLPPLRENSNVVLVNVDDASIEEVGSFPWTRDILADGLIFLREMGANQAVFDLNYLDKSPKKVDADYASDVLPVQIKDGFDGLEDTVTAIMDGFHDRSLTSKDAPDAKTEMLEQTEEVRSTLNDGASRIALDTDKYFSTMLRYFGNSYLTLTMVKKEELPAGTTFDMSRYDITDLENRIALKKITAKHDTKTPDCAGVQSAVDILLKNAKSAGFVNADPDNDGYRRRVHLLAKYNGNYYGQLVFVPLLKYFGDPEIEVTNSSITLKHARIAQNVYRDIRIPRAHDGSILIKWPKKRYEDYNVVSAWDVIKCGRLEKTLVANLKTMSDNNFTDYWNGDEQILDIYNKAEEMRRKLYNGENEKSGITFNEYLKLRQIFFHATGKFLTGGYKDAILQDIGNDKDTADYVSSFFSTCAGQYAELMKIREMSAKKMNGAICIIGTTATSTTDNGLITYQANYPNVGMHAALANMIIDNDFIDDSPSYVSILLALAFALLLGFASKQLGTKKSIYAGIVSIAAVIGIEMIFFVITKKYIGVIIPASAMFLTFITLTMINFFTTLHEKSFLHSAFSHYLSDEVIKQIVNDPKKLALGGEKREMTALFTDIRGFSTISEKLDPVQLVNLLNHYLTSMCDIILANKGTIDKFEGDAIIAFFGAPVHMEDHAVLACRSAIQMKKAEAELNKVILSDGESPSEIFTRMGINTGDMVVGNMGTKSKMNYTIMGNAVNLASRLEGVNKQYNTKGIMCSEDTKEQLGDMFVVRRLDRVRVVGVNTPIRLYEVIEETANASHELIRHVSEWEKALDLYESRKFTEAKTGFDALVAADADDKVSVLYSTRCADFLKTPPQSDWDGVFNLTQK